MTESSRNALTPRTLILGAQMPFVAFGALVLVPLLTGLDPNVAPFTAGAGIAGVVLNLVLPRTLGAKTASREG